MVLAKFDYLQKDILKEQNWNSFTQWIGLNVTPHRHGQYLVLVLRYWYFGRYWYWYWYWNSDFPGIGIGIGIEDLTFSSIGIGIGIDQITLSDQYVFQSQEILFECLLEVSNLITIAAITLLFSCLTNLGPICECYVLILVASIGIGIEVLSLS